MSRCDAPGPIYVLPVLDKRLVHAPLHGVTALVNGAAVAGLREGRNGSERLAELRAALEGEPEAEPRPHSGPVRPQFLGLLPTRACNLRCVYCGFGAAQAPGRQMEPELAVAAVDWMADEVQRSSGGTLDVHFFGGEPLAAPEVVEVAVHRTRAPSGWGTTSTGWCSVSTARRRFRTGSGRRWVAAAASKRWRGRRGCWRARRRS